MDCWEILGIEETWQEDVIRKAYLKKLPQFHPEENPEGFRILRRAMEGALKAAARMKEQESDSETIKQTDIMDSGEIRSFLKAVNEVYRDYGRRIQPGEWQVLLSREVCQDLETQREAGWALLGFLMKHFHIPHTCYMVMDRVFGWIDSREELSRHFPEGFINYLTDRIEEEDSFRYSLIPLQQEDFDYDKFCEGYFEFRTALREKDRNRAEEVLAELEAMGVEHPDLMILKIRHFSMIKGMEQNVWEMAKQLYETDRDHFSSRCCYVRAAMEVEDAGVKPEELEKIIAELLKEEPENEGCWQMRGIFLKRKNQLAQALQAFWKARECSESRWEYLEEQIVDTADALSRQMEAEGYEDSWEMANICWNGRRYDKVREILSEIQPPEGRENAWLILMAGSCHELEDYKAAFEYRWKLWEALKEENRPLALYMDLAEELWLTNDKEGAMRLYSQAAEKFPDESEIYYRQAKILDEEERQKEAVVMCEKALKIEFHREAFNLRLEIFLNMKEYEKVRDSAKQVLEQGYRSAQVLYDYAVALRKLEEYSQAETVLEELYERTDGSDLVCEEYALLYYDLDQAEQALKWIDEAIRKRDIPRRQYMRGEYLHELHRFEEEAAVYRQMIEKDPRDYVIFQRLGRTLEELDCLEEAKANFQTALEIRPDYACAWDGLGDIFQKQGKWEEAIEAYEKGAGFGYLQAARDLCRLLKRVHQDDRAKETMEVSLKKWPEDGSLLLLYSDILVRKKEYEAAVRCLNRYMEVRPSQTGRAYREIAMTYEKAKDLDKAQEYYQKAIDQEPGNARCWRLMGKFLANERKDNENALPYLEKSVELAPDSTYGFLKLGEVYEALGQKEKAVECYNKALENYERDIQQDPKDCCNYEGLADVLIHLGRLKEARETAHKAISLERRVFTCSSPMCYEAYEDLAKAEEQEGNLEKALEWMETAGRYATTEYYPNEIARLKDALEKQKKAPGDKEIVF